MVALDTVTAYSVNLRDVGNKNFVIAYIEVNQNHSDGEVAQANERELILIEASCFGDIWNLNTKANIQFREVLILGNIFGDWCYNLKEIIEKAIYNFLAQNVEITVILQNPKSEVCWSIAKSLNIKKTKFIKILEDSIAIYENIYSEIMADSMQRENINNLKIFVVNNLFAWEYHGIYTDAFKNHSTEAKSHVIRIYQLLRAQFRTIPKRFIVYQYKNKHRHQIFLDEWDALERILEEVSDQTDE